MKKLTALALAVLVLLSFTASVAETTDAQAPIAIGVTTQMSGYFYTTMWGNNAVDADIRAMLHGYGTVMWIDAGAYAIDETVAVDFSAMDGAEGRIYTITLAEGLQYNDGTPVRAQDYVFTILLASAPALGQTGATLASYAHLNGYEPYVSGASAVFSGVRLLSDTQFSVSVPSTAIPYFYELAYAAVEPTPIDVIAPDFQVLDDGDGAYLAVADETGVLAPAALTPELLATTLTASDGYLHQPKKTCGPYQLDSYDAGKGVVTLSANPYYQGNHEGRKPEMTQVQIVTLKSKDAARALEKGKVQALHMISDNTAIEAIRELETDGEASTINYLRSGYAFLAFACEQEPTSDVNVRQALAMCVDREALVQAVFGGNGLAVNGYYGYGQWMAAQHMDELTQFEIGYNVDAARALLVEAGYVYNEKGANYKEGSSQVRCRVSDGVLIPLELRWAKTESPASDALLEQLEDACDALGIRLTVDRMTFPGMLNEYYRVGGSREHNLFFLSDNFFRVFDPYYTYHTGDEWQGVYNTSGLRDTQLMEAAEAMRHVSGIDTDGYYTKWLVFQRRWREMMPTCPIYSNVYFDACIPTLYGYSEHAQYGFNSAMLYATFTAPEPEASDGGEVILMD